MEWLDAKPGNYLGQFAHPAADQIQAGNWYFDTTDRTLVYLPKNGNHFQPDSAGKKRVRLKVAFVRNGADTIDSGGAIQSTDTVALQLVEPYVWF